MPLFEKLDDDFEAHDGTLTGYEYARVLYLYEVLRDRPVAFWRLGEASGPTAYDVTSNSFDATAAGTPVYGVTGAVPNNLAVSFNGSDAAFTVPHDLALNLNASTFSIEFWARLGQVPGGSTTPGVLWKGDPTLTDNIDGINESGWAIWTDSTSKLTFGRNNETIQTAAALSLSTYRHLILTFDGASARWYVDGELDASGAHTFPASIATDILYFGRYATDFLNVRLDEIALYNNALSEVRVLAHYDAAKQRIPSAPLFNTLDTGAHYNVRSFHATDLTVPRTMNDMRFYNATHWNGATMLELSNQRVVEGRKFRPAMMDDLDLIDGEDHENMTMLDVERYTVSLGNEEWPVHADVTVGKVGNWRWANALQVQMHTNQTQSVASFFGEDLSTDFQDIPGSTLPEKHYIEFVLRDFPPQDSYAHLDLDLSTIDFSSDDLFEVEHTDSIPFSASLEPLDGGGDLFMRFDRDLLTKAQLHDMRRIKFRLVPETVDGPIAPSAAVNGAGSISDTVEYQVTFVTDHGESGPSAFSNAVTPSSQSVDVTIPVGPNGVTGRKLYRRGGADQIGTMTYLDSLTPNGMTTLNTRTMQQIEHFYTDDVGLVATVGDNTTTLVNDDLTVVGDPPPEVDSSADFIVKLQSMRLYRDAPDGFTDFDFNNEISVDTKRLQLARTIPRAGTPEWVTDMPPIWLNKTAPQNIEHFFKINSGHHAPLDKKNFLQYFVRYNPNTGEHLAASMETQMDALDNSKAKVVLKLWKDGEVIHSVTSASANEIQTITITGIPTGGTFKLNFNGQITGDVAYNASAGDIQTALEALSNIDTGDVIAAGGALPATPVTITFTGDYAKQNVPMLVVNPALTGGTNPTISITETTQGNPGVISQETDYYFRVECFETKLRATFYEAKGVYLGQALVTTDEQEVATVRRGYTGIWFKPYTYDFALDYMRSHRTEFAHFESQEFPSITPVIGATLYPHTSLPLDLISESEWLLSGEGVELETSPTLGVPPPAYIFKRNGLSWYGGHETADRIVIGDPEEVVIEGDLYPVTQARGQFRLVLMDKNDSVGFIMPIPGIIPNKWNHFQVPIEAELVPAGFRFFIHQTGFVNDEFRLDNVTLMHQTVTWQAKAHGGATYQPFKHVHSSKYTGLNFTTRGTELKVRATALSDGAWIQGYEITPVYAHPGHRTGV